MRMQSVQFSSVPYTIGSSGGHAAERQQRSSSSLVCRRPCEQFWHGQGCPLFDVVHQAFLLPTTASPTLQGALKDGFGEAVVACDTPEPCKFPSLDSCQKRVLWTHEDIVLAPHPSRWSCAPHPVVGPVLHVGDTEKSPQASGFESLGLFFRDSKQGPCFTVVKDDGGDEICRVYNSVIQMNRTQ